MGNTIVDHELVIRAPGGDPEHMRIRINRLWSDLLQVRTHFQLKALFGGGKEGA